MAGILMTMAILWRLCELLDRHRARVASVVADNPCVAGSDVRAGRVADRSATKRMVGAAGSSRFDQKLFALIQSISFPTHSCL